MAADTELLKRSEQNYIELRESNLYAHGKILSYPGGEEELDREPLQYTGSELDEYYTVKRGDMLDYIAYIHYKDLVPYAEFYWHVIADVNDIENPLDLSGYVGKELLIPNILQIKLLQ